MTEADIIAGTEYRIRSGRTVRVDRIDGYAGRLHVWYTRTGQKWDGCEGFGDAAMADFLNLVAGPA